MVVKQSHRSLRTTWKQLPVSVHHSTSVSPFRSSLKTLFSKAFSPVLLPGDKCVCECVHVWICLRIFVAKICMFEKYVTLRASTDEAHSKYHYYYQSCHFLVLLLLISIVLQVLFLFL